jgi:hypothetical protein
VHARQSIRGCICSLVLALVAAHAQAQSAVEVAARGGLLESATQASDRGDHARALELAQQAGRIAMSPSLRLFIANEEASLGRVAEALGEAGICRLEAERDPSLNNRAAIIAGCRALQTSLVPRVAHVTLHVSEPRDPHLTVVVAGEVLRETLYGLPYPVNPGDVVVEWYIGSGPHSRSAVHVAPGATVTIDVTPPANESASREVPSPATPPPHASAPPTVTTHTQPTPTAVAHPSSTATAHPANASHVPVGPVVAIAVGAAGLVAAGVFYGLRMSALSGCNVHADYVGCATSPEVSAAANANTDTIIADVAVGVGAVAIVAGVVWWIVQRPSASEQTSARGWFVSPTARATGVSVGGAF